MGHDLECEFRGTQKVNPDSSIGMDCLIGLRLLICEADNGKNVSRESKTGAHHHQHSHKPEPDLTIFRMLAWCQWHPNSPSIHSRTEGISPPRVKERLVNWNTADVLPKKFSRGDTFCHFIKKDFSGFRYLSAHNKGAICFLSRCNYSWAIIWKVENEENLNLLISVSTWFQFQIYHTW